MIVSGHQSKLASPGRAAMSFTLNQFKAPKEQMCIAFYALDARTFRPLNVLR